MFKIYQKYLETIDSYLKKCFEEQKPLIKCKCGCTSCCETGEYPFSRLEMEYLMDGFTKLDAPIRQEIKAAIENLLEQKNNVSKEFLHRCPFLSREGKCFLYERRGIVCRTHGLASFEKINGQKVIKLPECSKLGLNYSEIYSKNGISIADFQKFGLEGPIKHSLRLNFFERELLRETSGLEFGEIRPLLEWFVTYTSE